MFFPSNVPSLWRIDMVVWWESYHTVVNLFVFGSKPEMPVPVVFLPFASVNVKSDCRKRPSWIIRCLHVPCDLIGSPLAGKTVFSTFQSPANFASSSWPAPGLVDGS